MGGRSLPPFLERGARTAGRADVAGRIAKSNPSRPTRSVRTLNHLVDVTASWIERPRRVPIPTRVWNVNTQRNIGEPGIGPPEPEGGSIKATTAGGVDIRGPVEGRVQSILTPEALAFLAMLHRAFDATRKSLLEERMKRWEDLRRGSTLDFLPETRPVREGEWRVASVPKDLQDRRGGTIGAGGRNMEVNTPNTGAQGFMSELEESLPATSRECARGHSGRL